MSKELHPLWQISILNKHDLFFRDFRQEAIKIADDISALSINLRTNALEKILRQLLVGTKYTIPQQGNNSKILKRITKYYLGQIILSDNTSINEEQQSQVNYFSLKVKHKCYRLCVI